MHFVKTKGLLNARNGMNIYRGCQHGCIYCDARSRCYRMEHIFERYLVTDGPDTLPFGLGLGLPICRRIAQEHAGSILLTSEEGKGTAVTVSLPNKRSPIQELSTYKIDYAGGFNRTLVELADALPRQAFAQKHLD